MAKSGLPTAMSETLGVGSEIAGYRVTGLLGRGGMGFVYEAEHALLGRKAAIKTLSNDLGGDGDFRERFIQESQMVAALDHPSIIPIYDAGEEDGIVYIAMRYVGGGDLQELIAEGQLELDRAVSILEQVAGALDAAHAHDLVHRDVKPANVLIDSASEPRLPDRLRDREAGPHERADPDRLLRRDARLRGAGADPGQAGRAPGRRLRLRLPALRVPDGEEAVRPRDGRRGHARAPARPAAGGDRAPARAAGGARRRRRARAGQERGRADRLVPRGDRGGAGRASAASRSRPAARASTITARTRAVFVNFPSEPSPLIGRDEELAALVELAARRRTSGS